MRGGIQTELHIEGKQDRDVISYAVEEELYHIAQEALNNVLKHAGAQRVWVDLCFSAAEISLAIRDNGIGFTPTSASNGGLGFSSLRERSEKIGATLEIRSEPGSGTEIRVAVPISSMEELR
jgi:NarL family two-component system sensor histidine kinase LiaS